MNLRIPPTYLRSELTSNLEDYGKKESITMSSHAAKRSAWNDMLDMFSDYRYDQFLPLAQSVSGFIH